MRLRSIPPPPEPLADLERLLAQPQYQHVPMALLAHAAAVPLGIMVRGTMEWLIDAEALELLCRDNASRQYTRALTMAALLKLLIQVSAGVRASVFAAYTADQQATTATIPTSYQAVYGKIGRFSPAVSEALVRHSATKLQGLLTRLPTADPVLAGYRLRVVDGNVLAGTEHRLTPLRKRLNACLPGKSLVVYEPELGLVTDLILCEDAYTQERLLLTDLLPRAGANDLWVADRNFCTTKFVFGLLQQQACFVVRQHKRNLPYRCWERLRKVGETATGIVYEQCVLVTDPETGKQQTLRRIEVRLFQPTRDGERTLVLFSNLPETIAAAQIADLYRTRWTIESHFHFLTQSLHCEVPGLGKPRAALLMFALALVAGNALALVRAALRQAHGREAEAEVSGYYLADEIAGDYKTLMKYLPPEQWHGWQNLEPAAFELLLTTLARHVRLQPLKRHPRGPKKKPTHKPVYDRKHTHFSTARLLEEVENTC